MKEDDRLSKSSDSVNSTSFAFATSFDTICEDDMVSWWDASR